MCKLDFTVRLSSLLLLTLLATPAFAGPFAGATGGSGSSGGLGAGSTPLVVGELLFVGADGEAASVPGSIVDPGTGFISVVNIGSVEVTSTDINGMGTFANNDTGASTINNCSTSNATLTDDSFRIVDIDEGGTSGTIDYDIFEQCLGKTEALDDISQLFTFYASIINNGYRAAIPGASSSSGTDLVLSSVLHLLLAEVPLKKDQATGNYKDLFIQQMTCTIADPTAVGFAANECLVLPLKLCDIDGGFTNYSDCVNISNAAIRFARTASGDCASGSDVVCNGTYPCTGSRTINTTVEVQGSLVPTGSGQVDAMVMAHDGAHTDNTSDNGGDITSLTARCNVWYKN